MEKEKREGEAERLIETGNVVTAGKGGRLHCLSIIGQVEGHYLLGDNQKTTKYEHILPLLMAIEESEEVDGLLVLLNTMGGDVEAGLAIAEMIASMTKPTVSLVLGGGHSIGIPLAVAAKRSFIVPSATMTVHPVRINGLVIGVTQSFNHFRAMQGRITRFICEHSSIDEQTLSRLLVNSDDMAGDVGSILDGEEAVRVGLIDAVGGLSDAIAALKEMKEANA
ncbi:MAG: peptidase S14 [Ruminococcaceae bacterium]|nr:peptidase S14 [Oscillospiraceae bacterium]